jgi:hypothetical protein
MSERIEYLERSVRRWRLVSVALAILLACSLACGGTFTTLLLMHLPDLREMEMLRQQQLVEREQAEEARMQAERARQRAEQTLREAENAKRVFQDP